MRASNHRAQHRPCGSVSTSQRHSPSDGHIDMALVHGHALLHLAVLLLASIASLLHQVQPLPVTLLEDTKAAEPRTDTKEATHIVAMVNSWKPLSPSLVASNTAIYCPACRMGSLPPDDGGHRCYKCRKPVHSLPGCSKPAENANEGYGQSRICMDCCSPTTYRRLDESSNQIPLKSSEELKSAVKRSHMGESLALNSEANAGAPVAYYSNPSAAKRAPNLKPEEDLSTDWDQQPAAIYEAAKQEALAKELFGADDNPFDDKTIADYEKGFHYGTNKAKLDEQMENAILKSEMYGDPASINQYRYYGDDRRRKRSNAKRSIRFSNRYKREVDLSPEDILTLLSLWDEDRLRQPVGYRTNWPRYNSDLDLDNDRDENDIDEPDESWLESPVYPGVRNPVHMPDYPHRSASPYAGGFDTQPPIFASKRQWGGFGDKKRKRFMVSRKRSDPTRELRYLNGPASGHDDIYSLTQLLGPPPPREMGFPVYHRMVL